VEEIVALVGFSIVSSVTPGPNNMLLWASGAEFGTRRTVRHVLGTALGIGSMALAVVVGIGALIAAVPQVEVAMKVAGSLYLLYLAYQVAGAGALQRGAIARPLGIVQAAAFQVINPKAWTFAVGAVTTFRPSGLSSLTGGAIVAVVMMLVILPTAALWAAAGGAFSRLLVDERTHRIVSLVLAGLLALSVVSVWV
jgi:threonine/homoserine/homoserine lactone efflux protein